MFYNCKRNEEMNMFYALCTLMIISSFVCVRSESSSKDSYYLKSVNTAEDEGADLENNAGEVFHLLLNAPFNGRLSALTDDSSLSVQKRHKRNVNNAISAASGISTVASKKNQSEIQKLNATEAESLPVPEAIKWRWNDRPEDSRRKRIPDSNIRTEIPFNQRRRTPSRLVDDDIAYIMPQDFNEDNDFYRYQQFKLKSSPPRRRNKKNRQRLPPDEDVYSLYSAGRPYRRRSRTRPRIATYSPPKDKDGTIISSLINTGSDFLKMFNPFNLFSSSETEEPPPRYQYRERDDPRYHYSNSYVEEIPEKEYRDPSHFLPERRRPYDDETDVDGNYENLKILPPKFYSRERNEPSPDFNRDESLVDLDYGYDDYETGVRNYRTKTSSSRVQDMNDPRNSMKYDDERYAFRRKYPSNDRNYDFIFGKEKRSDAVKYSNEIFQNIDDTHTLDYLKEFPLRDDLYVAKDGNIYLKETKNHKMDLLGLDMYGMEYPEYAQESKQYSQLRASNQRMPPAFIQSSRSSARKSGREMDGKNKNEGIVDSLVQEFIKEKQKKNPAHPHSNFALKELTPT